MDIDGVVYKIATTKTEKELALNLIKSSYTKAELIKKGKDNSHIDKWHYTSTATVFVAVQNNIAVSTMTLILDSPIGVPMDYIYKKEMRKVRQTAIIAEISHFAQDFELLRKRNSLTVFIQLVGIMFQYAVSKGVQRLVIVSHPHHFKLYNKFLSFIKIGEEKKYDLVCDNPAIAGYHNVHPLDLINHKMFRKVKDIDYGFGNDKCEDYWNFFRV